MAGQTRRFGEEDLTVAFSALLTPPILSRSSAQNPAKDLASPLNFLRSFIAAGSGLEPRPQTSRDK
jgi:hypothetical protein